MFNSITFIELIHFHIFRSTFSELDYGMPQVWRRDGPWTTRDEMFCKGTSISGIEIIFKRSFPELHSYPSCVVVVVFYYWQQHFNRWGYLLNMSDVLQYVKV